MAISPLALGIGLQGKYDYRQQAALDLARERGRAKAEAAEAAGKEKKRAEIRKMVVNIKPQGLLPVHEKEINDGVADLLNYAMDNPEDFAGVTQGVHKLESRSLAAKEQARLINSLSRQSYFEGDKDALQVVMSTNDPAVLEENLSMLPTNIKYDKATSNLAVLNSKYKNTPTRIDEILSKGGDRYAQLTGEEEVIDVNGKKFIQRKFKPEVIDVALNDMLIGDNLQSSNDDYYTELKRQKIALPNLRTDEGRKEFADGRDAFLRKQITDDLSRRELLLNVTPSKGVNVSYNVGSKAGGVPVNFTQQSDIYVGPGKQVFRSFGGLPVQSDVKLTLPNDGETYNVKTGKRMEKADVVEGVYNRVGLGYIAKEDYDFPATKVKLQNGSTIIVPAKKFKKGEPLLSQYALQMAKQGKAKAGFVVFGEGKTNDGSPVELMRNYADMGVSRFLDATKYERADLNKLDQNAVVDRDRLQAKIDSYNQANAPASKIDISIQQGDVKKAKAAPVAPKQSVAPKANVKVKTAEQQASDERMRRLMEGK